MLYRVNDDVVIKANEPKYTPFAGKIKEFIVLNFRRSFHLYFAADYYHHDQEYRHRMLTNQVDHHTAMNMVYTNRLIQYNHECIKPVNHLSHKFISVGPASQDQTLI
jgi:thymidylate kinase